MDKPPDNLAHLPGTDLSPAFILHKSIADLDDIRDVVIVRISHTGNISAVWSTQSTTTLAAAVLVLQDNVTRVLMGDDPPK